MHQSTSLNSHFQEYHFTVLSFKFISLGLYTTSRTRIEPGTSCTLLLGYRGGVIDALNTVILYIQKTYTIQRQIEKSPFYSIIIIIYNIEIIAF